MQIFLATLLRCSVTMSVISILYMIAMPLLSKRYAAKWLYYVWLVVVIGWIFPLRPHFDISSLPAQVAGINVLNSEYMPVNDVVKIISGSSPVQAIWVWWIIAGIWLIGTLTVIIHNLLQHRRFLKMVRRWGENISDAAVISIFDTLKVEMKIAKNIGLKSCPFIKSPMMIGFFRPVILLPDTKISTEELAFVLRHELAHLERNDLWYRALTLLATAIHWFNPVVYLMSKVIAVQCEISCDELLVQESSIQNRKQYSETIIGMVRNSTSVTTELSTDFNRDGNAIKTRIFRIMDITKKKAAIALFLVILTAIIGSGITFASGLVTDNIQKIPINIEILNSKKFICSGGIYTLEEGDSIKYNITADGNINDLSIKLLREYSNSYEKKCPFQYISLTNQCSNNPDHLLKIDQSQVGKYYLLIGNGDEGVLSNIKGTIEITK